MKQKYYYQRVVAGSNAEAMRMHIQQGLGTALHNNYNPTAS
jgi:hypothetical protein